MGNTPKSDTHMPCGPNAYPSGMTRSKVPDGESVNKVEAFDGKKEVFPLAEKDYLDGACGLD